jgi:hypothetical protein
MLFGVIGTIITFSVVAPLTYIANNHQLFHITTWKTPEVDKAPSISNLTDIFHHMEDNTANDTQIGIPEHNAASEEGHGLRLLSSEAEPTHTTDISEIKLPENGIIIFSIKEILLFSSVISATDSVAALTFVKEETEPKLFAILFGEGVINDAVCIVLYNIIKNFFASSKEGNKIFNFRIYNKDAF